MEHTVSHIASIVTGLFAPVLAFFGISSHKEKPDMEQRFVDAYNESRKSWVAKGWVPPR